jgi:transcription antitermination factor NusG
MSELQQQEMFPRTVQPRALRPHQRKVIDRDVTVREMLERQPDWYALLVPPQKEFTAECMLRERHFDAFVPIVYRKVRISRHVKTTRDVPYVLASTYVFLGLNGPLPWSDIFKVHVIRGVAGAGGEPTCIPNSIMRQLFDASDAAGPKPPPVVEGLKVGDKGRITTGAFAGFEFSLEKLRGKRAQVIVSLFGRMNALELPVDFLEVR